MIEMEKEEIQGEEDIEAAEAELKRLEQEMKARRQDSMRKLLSVVLEQRTHAITQRQASGIETMWCEAEDAYEGLDEINKNDRRNKIRKPLQSGSSAVAYPQRSVRSTLVMNITGDRTDSASARLADMLMPSDASAFAIRPTPIPDIVEAMQKFDSLPIEQAEFLQRYSAEANRRAAAGEKRISDWLSECQFNDEGRKVIDDWAKLGTGCMKGPIAVNRKMTRYQVTTDPITGETVQGIVQVEKIVPASFRVSPWNLYPDPDCGESIHNGQYIFEKAKLSGKMLRELMNQPGYEEFQGEIRDALSEGPIAAQDVRDEWERRNAQPASDRDQFEVWYYYGCLDKKQLEDVGCDCSDTEDYDDYMHVVVTVVNDRIIRAAPNPLASGEFPYDLLPWRKMDGQCWGIGIPTQMNECQRMLTAAIRNLMDNAGLSGGPQIIYNPELIEPADGKEEITPRKIWRLKGDAAVGANIDIRSCFQSMTIDSRQEELVNIIQLATKMAEDITGLPMLLQGQQGAAPDTVGGMTILNNNANAVLRRYARQFDGYLTEPHIRRYYQWLLEYGEDESEKGDFMIDAVGSSALVERDSQYQFLTQMAQMVLDPRFQVNPIKFFEMLCESMRLDPKKIQYSEDEMREMQEKQGNAPPDPSIAVAQIRAQSDQQIAQLRAQIEQQKIESEAAKAAQDAQFKQMQLQLEAQADEANRQLKLFIEQMKEGFNQQKLEADQVISVAEMKTAMEMSAQKESNANQRFNTEVAIKQIQGSGI